MDAVVGVVHVAADVVVAPETMKDVKEDEAGAAEDVVVAAEVEVDTRPLQMENTSTIGGNEVLTKGVIADEATLGLRVQQQKLP